MLRIGADRVILPKEESGYQLADELSIPGMLERLHLSQDYSLIEIKIPPATGRQRDGSLRTLRGERGAHPAWEELIINPDQGTRFSAGDILVLVGEKRRLAEFCNLE